MECPISIAGELFHPDRYWLSDILFEQLIFIRCNTICIINSDWTIDIIKSELTSVCTLYIYSTIEHSCTCTCTVYVHVHVVQCICVYTIQYSMCILYSIGKFKVCITLCSLHVVQCICVYTIQYSMCILYSIGKFKVCITLCSLHVSTVYMCIHYTVQYVQYR